MINPISIALSGLSAASKKAEIAASNVANADVVGSRDIDNPNQAYAAKTVVHQSLAADGGSGGVRAVVLDRNPPFIPSFSPDSPFADENGLVNSPNVNLDEEIVSLKVAEQAYAANAQTIKTAREMQDSLLDALNHKA